MVACSRKEGLPVSVFDAWHHWQSRVWWFLVEFRRAVSNASCRAAWSVDKGSALEILVKGSQRCRERLRLDRNEGALIEELVGKELGRLSDPHRSATATLEWCSEHHPLLVGERVVVVWRGTGKRLEGVVRKATARGAGTRGGVLEIQWLLPAGGRRPGKKGVWMGDESELDLHEVWREKWSEVKLWRAEAKRQDPESSSHFSSSFEEKDLIVGDRVWATHMGELDISGVLRDGVRWVEPVEVVRRVLKVAGKWVGDKNKKSEFIVREAWRSDGKGCREFPMSFEDIMEVAFWRENWNDNDERWWRMELESLENLYGDVQAIAASDFVGEADWVRT